MRVGLVLLAARAQLAGVVLEQLLDVEHALGVEVRDHGLGALAEATLRAPLWSRPISSQWRM